MIGSRRRLAWTLLLLSPALFGPLHVGLMAWAALGEAPQWYHLTGTLLVLLGFFLATRPPAKGG